MVLSQGLHQLVEWLVEFRYAFVLKLLSHLVDANSKSAVVGGDADEFRRPWQDYQEIRHVLFLQSDLMS